MKKEDIKERAEQLLIALRVYNGPCCSVPCYTCNYYFMDKDGKAKCFAESLAYYIAYQKERNT